MLRRTIFLVFLVNIFFMGAVEVQALHQDVSVKYLIAALGTLKIRDRISVTALYVGSEGMEEAVRGPFRNKGLTRFSIKDTTSSSVFDLMYCEVGSSVFKALININDNTKAFVFEGVKMQGENNRGSIIVKSVRIVRNVPKPVSVNGPAATGSTTPDKFRIIMINQATSNRTVTADVVLDEKYNIQGNTVIIQNMNDKSSDVGVVQ